MTDSESGRAGAREPAGDDSRGKARLKGARTPSFIGRVAAAGPAGWAVLLLGLSAAFLLIAAEFSTMHTVRVGDSTCGVQRDAQRDICETTGLEQHYGALILLGVFVLLLAIGAAVGRSRPAAVGLVVVGVVVLFIALALDRPTFDDTQGFEAYDRAEGVRGGAYTLELIGAGLAMAAGGLALLLAGEGVRVPRVKLPAMRRGGSGGSDSDDEPEPETAEERAEARRRARAASTEKPPAEPADEPS